MTRAIREHLRDFIAILALTAAGIVTAVVILANQASVFPEWMPFLGTDRFELRAEFSSAQAVTPGQGQSVDIAGIRVGDVTGVELVDGHAEVTMEVEDEYGSLINEDASLLLRPKTGLNDMVIEVDRGISTEQIEEGATIPLASTQPNVNPDEILAALDADTQSFLKLLLGGGAEALDPAKGRDRKLSGALRQLEPFARDVARITGGLAQRRENVRNSIHNFRLLAEELGNKDRELSDFVASSNEVLDSFAAQEASIRATLRELPGALSETNAALGSANRMAIEAAPALRDLLPGARALAPALRATRPFLRKTVAPIRDQIRPFTRQVFQPVSHLRQAIKGLANTVPPLKTGFIRLNEGLNALAANPTGSAEGYLFYLPWMNHDTNSLFTLQDAHGPLRRGIVLQSCGTARFVESSAFQQPFIQTLIELTGQTTSEQIC